MTENNQFYDRDPWEQSSYETGNTRPPKKRTGCIVVLLSAVALLGGIFSVASRLAVNTDQPETTQGEVAFTPEEQTTTPSQSTTDPTEGSFSIDLDNSPQSVANVPQEGGLSLQEIYEKAISSVVSITGNNGSGTGVVIHEGGYIVTNHHVINGNSGLQVLLSDGNRYDAQVVGSDAISDLAVLTIEAEELIPAEFGDSGAVRVGDAVVAIGDPLGVALRGTMTDGIISAINRDITTEGRTMTLLQTNAALNQGNSGGPLLNCYGQVIGINTMKIGDYVTTAGVEGLGFAIPSATVKEVVDQLVNQGYVSGRPSLGVSGQILSAFDRMYYRLPQGIYITQVSPGSNAEAQGIRPGDIILEFEGQQITDSDTLNAAINSYQAGDSVLLKIYRKGEAFEVSVILDEAT